MIEAITRHWPEYLIEGALLGAFMVGACLATVALEHPASPLRRRMPSAIARRAVVGVLMGVTAVALISSGPGRRSGAHMNPAVTLTFLVLGKVEPWDAMFYAAAQFLGGVAGVGASSAVLRHALAHPAVGYAVTLPGPRGAGAAWIAEFAIAAGMMGMVLASTSHASSAPYTGVLAGVLLAAYITFEAPLSGMSLNPARTLASARFARRYRGLWVYFTAPPAGMLSAAGLFAAASGHAPCAKLDHSGPGTCIFRCEIDRMPGRVAAPGPAGGISRAARPHGTER